MSDFTDKNGDEIGYLTYDLEFGEESTPIVISVVAQLNRTLKSSISSIVQLLGREHGTLDPFTDLSGGIPLSIYTPGSTVQFDIKAMGLTGVGSARAAISLGFVLDPTGAGWAN